MLEWNEPKKNCIYKIHFQEDSGEGVRFSAIEDMQVDSFSKTNSITDAFFNCKV